MEEYQIESCQKCLLVKTYEWHTHKKVSHADLIKKGLTRCVKKDAYAAAKHKIILSRPYNELITL